MIWCSATARARPCLNDLSVRAKIAQEQLGHASMSTTLNIYTHAVDASHRKAIEAVERELFGFWTTVDYKRQQGQRRPNPQVALWIEFRNGGARI
jgi:hypothetical protein